MTPDEANLQIVRAYLTALERGVAGAGLGDWLHPEVVQVEHPNRLKPDGDRRNRTAMMADSLKGAQILRRQTYVITEALACEGKVAIEVLWEGELSVAMGSLTPGDTLVVRSAMMFEFKDRRIVAQRNYDCVEAF